MIWQVRIRDVRRRDDGLRWTLVASTPDLEAVVSADTTARGTVFDLQSDEYIGTTGDEELDWLVSEAIQKAIARRNTHQQLDRIEGRPAERSDRLRGKWAA